MIFNVTEKSARRLSQKKLIDLVEHYFDFCYKSDEDEVKFGVLIAELQSLLRSQLKKSLQNKFVHFNGIEIDGWNLDHRSIAIKSLVNQVMASSIEQKFSLKEKSSGLSFQSQTIDDWLVSSVVCVFAEFGYFDSDLVTDYVVVSLKNKSLVLGKERSVAEQIAIKLMQNLYRAVAFALTIITDAKLEKILQKQLDGELELVVKKLIERKVA